MAKNPEHYAIVIGINGYKQILPLKAAVEDATRFAAWLIKEEDGGGLPPENVKLIVSPAELPINPYDARPIQQEIDTALVEMGITTRERIGQRLYFYFAGHGIGPTFDDIGMLMATAAMTQLNYNVGLRPYRLFFHDRKPFDEIVFIIDCCRDPISNVKLGEPSFNLPGSAVDKKVQDFVVMAAEYGEKAFEPRDSVTNERRSILTKAVLEGLENFQAADPLGRVTARSLWEYVKENVPKLSSDHKLRQIPKVDLNNLTNDIVIYTRSNSALPKVKVHINTTVAEVGGSLNLLDHNMRLILSQPTAQATDTNPWEVFLVKGKWYALNYSVNPNAPPMIIDLTNAGDETVTITYK